MSKAKKAVEQYLRELDAGRTPEWARKTEFIPLRNGSMRRRITRSDGTVEKSEIISAGHWQITAARAGTGLSQADFAKLIGVSRSTLQEWEQGRKQPSGAARVLLNIAASHPELLREALNT
jgi:Predicted transcriptional regulator